MGKRRKRKKPKQSKKDAPAAQQDAGIDTQPAVEEQSTTEGDEDVAKAPAAEATVSRVERFKGAAKGFAIFVLGTIAGPFILHLFVGLLPGPGVYADVRLFRAQEGCRFYGVAIWAPERVDHFDVQINFPQVIDDQLIGVAEERELNDTYWFPWAIDRASNGTCVVSASGENNFLDVAVGRAGTTVSVQGSELPRRTYMVLAVATKEGVAPPQPPDFQPRTTPSDFFAGDFYAGDYQYSILGVTVTKPVKVYYSKIGDPTPWPSAGPP
jgi:hypothetical protein